MIDDILYGEIASPNGSKRYVTRRINDQIEVEFEVVTQDGEDEWNIKSITVESKNSKVIVDSRTVHDPNPVYTDDACYLRKGTHDWQEVRNMWTATSSTLFNINLDQWWSTTG